MIDGAKNRQKTVSLVEHISDIISVLSIRAESDKEYVHVTERVRSGIYK